MIAVQIVALLSTLHAPQGEQKLVARYQIDGQSHALTRDDLSLFLVRRTRNSDSTKAAIDHLIDVKLVELAAKRLDLMPNTRDVDAEVRSIELRLKRENRDFDKFLATRRMSRATIADQMALSIAHRRLTAKTLRMDPQAVTPKQLELWTKQQRNRTKIVTDAAELAPGVIARVGPAEITKKDLGEILFMKADPNNLLNAVREIVFMRITDHLAHQEKIQLAKADFERQFRKTKNRFERSARNHGLSYEDWLVAMGGSKQKELDSPTMRSILQHERLVRRKYPPTLLDDMLAKQGAELLRRHGARRSMSIILVRATDKPNKIVRRGFKAALEHAKVLRQILTRKNETFANVAGLSSDHSASKGRGGKIGWQHAEYLPGNRSQRAPKEVLDRAFEMAIGKISEPIKTDHGYYIVWVSGVEPRPDRATLHRRILGELSEKYSTSLIQDAKIEMLVK